MVNIYFIPRQFHLLNQYFKNFIIMSNLQIIHYPKIVVMNP